MESPEGKGLPALGAEIGVGGQYSEPTPIWAGHQFRPDHCRAFRRRQTPAPLRNGIDRPVRSVRPVARRWECDVGRVPTGGRQGSHRRVGPAGPSDNC